MNNKAFTTIKNLFIIISLPIFILMSAQSYALERLGTNQILEIDNDTSINHAEIIKSSLPGRFTYDSTKIKNDIYAIKSVKYYPTPNQSKFVSIDYIIISAETPESVSITLSGVGMTSIKTRIKQVNIKYGCLESKCKSTINIISPNISTTILSFRTAKPKDIKNVIGDGVAKNISLIADINKVIAYIPEYLYGSKNSDKFTNKFANSALEALKSDIDLNIKIEIHADAQNNIAKQYPSWGANPVLSGLLNRIKIASLNASMNKENSTASIELLGNETRLRYIVNSNLTTPKSERHLQDMLRNLKISFDSRTTSTGLKLTSSEIALIKSFQPKQDLSSPLPSTMEWIISNLERFTNNSSSFNYKINRKSGMYSYSANTKSPIIDATINIVGIVDEDTGDKSIHRIKKAYAKIHFKSILRDFYSLVDETDMPKEYKYFDKRFREATSPDFLYYSMKLSEATRGWNFVEILGASFNTNDLRVLSNKISEFLRSPETLEVGIDFDPQLSHALKSGNYREASKILSRKIKVVAIKKPKQQALASK